MGEGAPFAACDQHVRSEGCVITVQPSEALRATPRSDAADGPRKLARIGRQRGSVATTSESLIQARRAAVPSRAIASDDASRHYAILPELTWEAFSWFLGKRVPSASLIYPETPRRARVSVHGGEPFFDFAENDGEDGEDAIIFLARDDEGSPSDLIAWTRLSRRLAAHWGAVSVLGADDVIAPRLTPEGALLVHRTPLGWLRAERQGVVVVEARGAASLLSDFGPLAGEDEAHGRELRQLFRRTEPKIYVPERRAA
jgi:hypothetical protein